MSMQSLTRFIPLVEQARTYDSSKFSSDLVAAIIVTIMLIPQSLAYALLAGMPPQAGLYASILPLLLYAVFGSSRTLAVGPVAIASLMTASALAEVTQAGIVGYVEGAMILALLSGVFLFLLGVLRLGFLSHFLSHSVVAGFMTASALVIALSQMKHILGIDASGHNFYELMNSLLANISGFNLPTLLIGAGSVAFLYWARSGVVKLLIRVGMSGSKASLFSKVAPVIGIVVTTVLVSALSLDQRGVAIVGSIPSSLPNLSIPSFSIEAVKALLMPAILISVIGYVESISVGKTLSIKKGQHIDGDQELLGLGASNIAAGVSGGFPVTGGFARSVVNYDAGAETQFAGIFTALGITLATLFFVQFLHDLPIAMLAATIIVAVLSIVELSIFKEAWRFSKSDFAAVSLTTLLTLFVSVEMGVASGIVTSIFLHLYNTSKPHIAEIGLIQGTQHFRNVKHFNVLTVPNVVSLRIDESLIFSNAGYLEDYFETLLTDRPYVTDIVLHCGAINTIDLSALEMLERQNHLLKRQNKRLHLTHLKIPVKKMLDRVGFIEELSGELFLSHYDAYQALIDEGMLKQNLSSELHSS